MLRRFFPSTRNAAYQSTGASSAVPTGIVEEVPTEIWTHIVSFAEASDVKSLAQVSHSLRQMLYSISIWASVLRSICKDNAIFLGSYPIDEMSLLALQRAALGPSLWNAMLEKHLSSRNPKNLSIGSTKLKTRSSRRISIEADQYFLVPGGRFLVTANLDLLALWDLGFVGQPPKEEPELICKIEYGSHFYISQLAICELDDDTLQVAVATELRRPGSAVTVRLYHVRPASESPAFEKAAETWLEVSCGTAPKGGCRSISIRDSRIFVNLFRELSEFFVFWDISTNRCIAMQSPAPSDGTGDSDINATFTGEYIITFSSASIQVFRVSFDHPAATHADENLGLSLAAETHWSPWGPPETEVQFPFEAHTPHSATFSIPSGWHHGTHLPLVFDIITRNVHPLSAVNEARLVSSSTFIRRFMLDVTSGSTCVASLELLATSILQPPQVYRPRVKAHGSYDLGFASTTMLLEHTKYQSQKTVIYSIIQPSSVSEKRRARWALSESEQKAGVDALTGVTTMHTEDVHRLSFCSVSGRSVYRIWDDKVSGAAFIDDYIY
ncbi:hypothetical protein DFP72DRAFT_910570 [Ephemerocybe angulata]|uniref:F-box domain-containing protein n=1 Tax=Ephemerocybe angulata TaxID=980116 RepID=A0A8H6M387_9AGAR|nr:hypothetical protein DFP72DRAFT_910570 [Tulosesus angulatus]